MAKRVRITLEVSSSFVRMLKIEMHLKRVVPDDDQRGQLTASQVLGLVALHEAMGAPKNQTWMNTPIEWRPDIDVVSEERKVFENGVLVGGGA